MPLCRHAMSAVLTVFFAGCLGIGSAGIIRADSPSTPAAPVRERPADSFLPHGVVHVRQLVRQVQADPVARKHYARYFHQPETAVIQEIRAQWVESMLPRTEIYTVYRIRPTGTIYPVRQTLTAGTRVFARRHGAPVMLCDTGNPIAKYVTPVEVRYKDNPAGTPVVKVAPSVEAITANQDEIPVTTTELTPVYQPAAPPSDPTRVGAR